MFFVIEEVSEVEVAIGGDLCACAALLVVVELALVELAVLLDVDAPSLPLLPLHLSEVDLVVALYQLQPRTLQQLLHTHPPLRKHLVTTEILAQLVLTQRPDHLHRPHLLD